MTQPYNPSEKALGKNKLSRIPVKVEMTTETLRKPDWIRIKLPTNNKVDSLKKLLRQNKMVTVCEEASCPNLSECFSHGIAAHSAM
jgi:lipoyl synthase